jgi:C-methyltransferase C-terminal domain
VANNVVAHVPELNDFLSGLAVLLAPDATLSLEFHHLLSLVEGGQFDTIYHEHFQYFSLASITTALERHGLQVVDVEELTTQGGSLRVYVRHAGHEPAAPSSRVPAILAREAAARLTDPATYHALAARVDEQRGALLSFLVDAKRSGRKAVCFGAAAKGNTLLNCCGVDADLVDYVVDSNPHKQGMYLPGSRIPIVSPETVALTRPDYLVILPWNLRAEVMAQMADIRSWGGRFVVPGPRLEVLE